MATNRFTNQVRPDLLGGQRPPISPGRVIITAADGFDGYEIMSYHGIAWGISVRSKDLGQDCFMVCKSISGGELESYAALGDEARQRAVDRMLDSAKRMGANAIIGFTFELEMAQGGAGMVTAHGTAVTIRPIPNYIPLGAAATVLAEIGERLRQPPPS